MSQLIAPAVVPFPMNVPHLYAYRTSRMDKQEVHAYEQYRVLRSRILDVMKSRSMHSLLITSAAAEEAKTSVSLNLAVALSHLTGVRVLLVDGDLRKPAVAKRLGRVQEATIETYLTGKASFDDVICHFDNGLSMVPAGGGSLNSVELFQSPRMREFVEQARRSFDLAIYDSSPLLPVADSRVLANWMDAILLCVRSGHTSDTSAVNAFELVRSRVIGSVLVCSERNEGSGYYYYESDPLTSQTSSTPGER